MRIEEQVQAVYQKPLQTFRKLSGNGITYVAFNDEEIVVKDHQYHPIEAKMIADLSHYLPMPKLGIIHEHFFSMQYLQATKRVQSYETKIAFLLAKMHQKKQPYYGYDYDTTIGPYPQSNTRHATWGEFFIHERIYPIVEIASKKGHLDTNRRVRIEQLLRSLEGELSCEQPSMIHGDIWSGNIIATDKEVYFIDPAIYYAHREMELAFIRMFDTLGETFFGRYNEIYPIEKGFFNGREHLYMLYPVLVHIASFGSGYVASLEKILRFYRC